MIAFQDTASLLSMSSNIKQASIRAPHLPYMSKIVFATQILISKPHLTANPCSCIPSKWPLIIEQAVKAPDKLMSSKPK
ncbi:hypothetical protein VIGAN_03210700 [Vigna angularis var. angularis]|uniref:Uncharacterized protein n=1 Tax=Vigna angularis var. angularis TaxID=157739 RepID=A0A0S3RNN8_PHAAN|nr:hypothetical protein VIGAN_03210700 [Vigna angularis var. angularis]